MIRSNLRQLPFLVLTFFVIGCGAPDEHGDHGSGTQKGPAPEGGHEGHGDHDGHDDHDGHSTDSDPFAKLSAADAAAAKAQETCPVSDERLGSMGVPLKVTVKDQVVFICCEGCRKRLLRQPDKYLQKLKK